MAVTGIDWLGGYPKSGTTWVRAFLCAYRCPDEFDINQLGRIGNADTGIMYWQQSMARQCCEATMADVALYRPAAMTNLLRSWAAFGPDRNPVVKTHTTNARIVGIDMMPQILSSRAVYLVRDPRDVAISFSRYFDCSIDQAIEWMGEQMFCVGKDILLQPIQSWSLHVQGWHNAEQKGQYPVLFVRYEDLLSEPHDWFCEILTLLEWPIDHDVVDRAIELTTLDRLRSAENENGFKENRSSYHFFHTGGRQWPDVLTREQHDQIIHDHGETMRKLGYSVEDLSVAV